MEIDSYLEDNFQAYSVLFNRCRFGFTSKINMENLKYFSIANQQKLGKIDIRININALRMLPNNLNFNYLVMTQYQHIIPLIYLLRSQPSSCKILATKSMIESGKIYAQDFYYVVKKMNQVVSKPTFEQQGQIYDDYQLEFKIQFSRWASIFTKEQINNFVLRCISLNYGQVYDTERGILLTPYPSGINIGSAAWLFENTLTKNKCLWIQGISHHNWRACRQFYIDPIHHQINNVIFTVGVLTNSATSISDEHQCLQFLKTIFQRLNKGHNTRIVIQDFLIIADIINYVVYEFKDKFRKLFFTGGSINKYMSYVNSFVEFLTSNHQKRIYEDPPVYPFQSYDQLRQKFIAQGTIEQVSTENKVSVKQMIIRSTPYLHFQSDFHAFLVEGENQVTQKMFDKYYSLDKLRQWLGDRKIQKITYICKAQEDIKNIPDLGHAFSLNLIGQNIYLEDEGEWKYYTTQGAFPGLICNFTKKNGWLKLNSVDQRFRQLNKQWHEKISSQMNKLGIDVLSSTETQISTKSTKITLRDYKLFIQSQSEGQLKIIDSLLNQCSRIFKLG